MSSLLCYDQLDSLHRPAARASAVSDELWCARDNVKERAATSKTAIHQAVNDQHRVTRLQNTFLFARGTREEPVVWIEKRTLGNLYVFSEQDDMYPSMQ